MTIRTKDDHNGKLQRVKLSGKRSFKLALIVVRTDIIGDTRLSKLLKYHQKDVYREDAKDDNKGENDDLLFQTI